LTINDRLTQGFISGLLAGVLLNLIDYISLSLNIVEITYLDWAGTILFGYQPNTLNEHILALLAQILFSGILGIIFAYIIPFVTSKNILLKGLLYALSSWFFIYAIAVLFKVQGLVTFRADTVISDIFTVSIFGISLAYFFKKIIERTKL